MESSENKDSQILSEFTQKKPGAAFKELLVNIIIPIMILTNLSSEDRLGIKLALFLAFLLPLIYGLNDYIKNKNTNFLSILGIISVSLSGGLALLEADAIYIAIKEASIPLIFACAILYSLRGGKSLIHYLIENPTLVNVKKVLSSLEAANNFKSYNKLLKKGTVVFALSFLLSALLNFLLAIFVLTGEPGTEEFNYQLAKMLALSFPVNALPPMIINIVNIIVVYRGMKKLTGLNLEEIFNQKG